MTLTEARPWVGRSVRRVEDHRLLTGQGMFTDDVPLGDTLYLAVLRSPYPAARITRLDIAAARTAPGVVDAIDGWEVVQIGNLTINAPTPDAHKPRFPLIATDQVRYVGEVVAAVIATSRARALDAVDLMEVEYQPLPSVATAEAALADGAPLVHPEFGTNLAYQVGWGAPAEEVDAALARAEHVVSVRVVNPRVTAMAMEPRAIAVTGLPDEDGLRVWSSTQRPFGTRGDVADALGMPTEQVHVIGPDVGGGFGAKGYPYREEMLAAYFARKHRASVRWTATRSDDFQTMMAGRDQVTSMDAGFSRSGDLQVIRARIVGNLGAYLYRSTALPPTRAARTAPGAYRVPLGRSEARGVFTHTGPTGPYRGAGRPEGALLIERAMDVAARELGLDPVAIRRRNFIPPEAFPWTTPTGHTYDSGEYQRTLDRALNLADYPALLRQRAAARERGELFGVGVATFVEPSGGPGYESGRVRVEPDGRVIAESGSFAHGQGHLTTFAQIVADRLGVPMERVRVVQGDTRVVPEGVGTSGSRSTALGGSAVAVAAEQVLEKMNVVAAHLLEAEPADVAYAAGTFHPLGVPSRAVTFEQVAAAAHDAAQLPAGIEPGLVAGDRFTGESDSWPNGAHVAAVSIDRETGRLTVLRYVAVDDAGVLVNPLLVEGQVLGGLAQGFGAALSEQIVHDEAGQLLTGSLGDYAVPRASDLPAFTLGETSTPSPLNPLGAKGVGEGGTVGAPPTLANAVMDALAPLGVRHLDPPYTAEKLWQASRSSPLLTEH